MQITETRHAPPRPSPVDRDLVRAGWYDPDSVTFVDGEHPTASLPVDGRLSAPPGADVDRAPVLEPA